MLMFHFKIEWEFTVWVIWETDLLTHPGYLSSSKHLLIVMPSSKADITNHPVQCSYVIIAINISIIVTIAIIRIRLRKHILRMIWMRRNYWSRLEICKYVKFANTSNLQICKLSCCLSASQSSNRAAKWLHIDSSTGRKWERYSIALCFCLFSFSLSFLNRSFSAIFVGGEPICNILVAKIITSAVQSS